MPRPKNDQPRVSEPYWDKNREQWRVIVRCPGSPESRIRFESKSQALEYIANFNEGLQENDLTVEKALDAYQAHQKERQLRKSTIDTAQFRLRKVLSLVLAQSTRKLTPAKVLAGFTAYHAASTTKHSTLREIKGFSAWAQKEGLTSYDLASSIEFDGKILKGKAKLRRQEARLFWARASQMFQEGNEAGLAVLLALGLGLRTSEVMDRVVADCDDNATLLWVDKSKSEAGIRQVELPPELAEMLRKQIEGKKPTARVFQHYGHQFIRDWTKRICQLAGVKEVTGQGLRGTFATLAISQGVAPMVVAQTIGHSDTGVTLGGAYAQKGSVQTGGAKHLMKVIQNKTDFQDQSRTKIESDSKQNKPAQ